MPLKMELEIPRLMRLTNDAWRVKIRTPTQLLSINLSYAGF